MSRSGIEVIVLLAFGAGVFVGVLDGLHGGRIDGRRAGYTAAVDSVRATPHDEWVLGYWQGIAACDSEWLAIHDENEYERRLARTRRDSIWIRRPLTEGGR